MQVLISHPNDRILRARIASAVRWSREADRSNATAPARAAFNDRFARQVDPDGKLPEPERQRRAESARKAYYLRLALRSAQVRRGRKVAGGGS